MLTGWYQHRSTYLNTLESPIEFPVESSQLHLIIPATHTDLSLCKTVLSAAVLNYSTPTLLNWGKPFNHPGLLDGGQRIAEISGTFNYLTSLDSKHDDDLVLVIDGSNTWFQLRPEQLIQRYFDLNLAANRRIRRQLGRAASIENISQSIIFTSQKSCGPHKPDDIACYAVPESTLPRNIFGPDTDVLQPEASNPYQSMRPRSLSTSLVIGPVGAMRKLYSHAQKRCTGQAYRGSSRDLLAVIFGEQEYQREIMRKRHLSSDWWRMAQLLERLGIPTEPMLDSKPGRKQLKLLDGESREFGIGLDYEGVLGYGDSSVTEHESDWLIHNSSRSIAAISKVHHIKQPHVRPSTLPRKLLHSTPPFPNLHITLPKYASWLDVPLYTNLYSASIPVAAQNAVEWTKMWWQPHMRYFLHAHTEEDSPLIAEAAGRRWWSPVRERGGVNIENMGWVPWEQLCAGEKVEQELFGYVDGEKKRSYEIVNVKGQR
jgi:hypothetical protein